MTTKIKPHVRQDGGWALIGTQVASNSASLTQTGLDSTYDTYVVGLSNMIPSGDGNNPRMRFGDSSGVDSGGSDYVGLRQMYQEGSTSYDLTQVTAASSMLLGASSGTGSEEGYSGMFWILNPGDAGVRNTIYGYFVSYTDSPEMRGGHIRGMREAIITLDRVNFFYDGSNTASGRMTVWGISHT